MIKGAPSQLSQHFPQPFLQVLDNFGLYLIRQNLSLMITLHYEDKWKMWFFV